MIIITQNKNNLAKNNNLPIRVDNSVLNNNFGTDITNVNLFPILLIIGAYFFFSLFDKKNKITELEYFGYGKDKREERYEGKIEQHILNNLTKISKSIDESKPYKYFDWIIKEYNLNKNVSDIFEKIREYVSSFDFYVKNNIIKGIDINQYNLSNLIELVNEARKYTTKISIKRKKKYGEGLIEDKDYKVMFENNYYTVITPLTYEGSCFYGKTTKWCISMHNEPMHWKNYEKLGIKFYFIIDNNEKSSKYGYALYAVAVYPHLEEEKPLLEIYDENDKIVSIDKFKKMFI